MKPVQLVLAATAALFVTACGSNPPSGGAVEKCDASREAHGIVARPYVYALNDKVVYEEMIRKAQKSGDVSKEREAQKELGEELTEKIEVDVAPAEEM